MHENVVSDQGFGNEIEADSAGDPAKLNASDTAAVDVVATQHLAGDGETHVVFLHHKMMAGAITWHCDRNHRSVFTVNKGELCARVAPHVTRLTGMRAERA
jgi:hypothetical protein